MPTWQVVKSLEPFFNVVFGAIFMKDVLPWKVNACLLPVVAGVALASAGELDFTWDCFFFAMGSTVAFSVRRQALGRGGRGCTDSRRRSG